MTDPSGSQGPGFNAVQPKCPLYPKAGPVQASAKSALPGIALLTDAPCAQSSTLQTATENIAGGLFVHSPHKRGPPIHLL